MEGRPTNLRERPDPQSTLGAVYRVTVRKAEILMEDGNRGQGADYPVGKSVRRDGAANDGDL
jgi:hypothetical protein